MSGPTAAVLATTMLAALTVWTRVSDAEPVKGSAAVTNAERQNMIELSGDALSAFVSAYEAFRSSRDIPKSKRNIKGCVA